jgi:hypothetical protein
MATSEGSQNLDAPWYTGYIQTVKGLGIIMLIGVSHKWFSDQLTDRLRNSPQTEAKFAANTASRPVSGRCSNGEGRHWQMEMGTKPMVSSCWFISGDRASHTSGPSSGRFRDVQMKKRWRSTTTSFGDIFRCWGCVNIGNGHRRCQLTNTLLVILAFLHLPSKYSLPFPECSSIVELRTVQREILHWASTNECRQ